MLEGFEDSVGPHGAGEEHPSCRIDFELIADRDHVVAEPRNGEVRRPQVIPIENGRDFLTGLHVVDGPIVDQNLEQRPPTLDDRNPTRNKDQRFCAGPRLPLVDREADSALHLELVAPKIHP